MVMIKSTQPSNKERLSIQLSRIDDLYDKTPFGKEFFTWNVQAKKIIQESFGPSSPEALEFCKTEGSNNEATSDKQTQYREVLDHKKTLLQFLIVKL
ncbi:MAG: hypothetical protein H0Z39_02515 [Peptococcaceae bacterium]|nr:hypothetical protein [Peptococcaceae bacterium]